MAKAKKPARKRKAPPNKKAGKPSSARRAVNIKVNVVSKNPRKRKTVRPKKKRARARSSPAAELMRRKRAKMKFIVCATTRKGKKYYFDGAAFKSGAAGLRGAQRFAKFDPATRKARSLLKRAAPAVASISVEKA
jgi:hypothetical protein